MPVQDACTKRGSLVRAIGLACLIAVPQSLFPQIATYNISAGANAADPLAGTPNVSNLSAGNMTRVGVTPSSSTGNFRATNWPLGATNGSNSFTGSLGTGQYIQFSLTPDVGYSMDVTGIAFGIGRSATGPRQFSVRTSADAFAADLTGGTAGAGAAFASGIFTISTDASTNVTGNSLTLSGPSFTGITGTLTVRVYGFNAEGAAGTGGLAGNLVISGAVNAVGGCGISLLTHSTTCDALTNGIDTYDLMIPYTGVSAGISVVNNGLSGTISGDNPSSQNGGTIIISNINEGDGYSVTFSSPCDALNISGSSPSCVPPTCGISLGTPSTFCNANTAGVDTYDLSIPYTGSQSGVTVINNSGSGTLAGDDPASVSGGTILITGISEANGYSVTFSSPCETLTASGSAPVCEPPPVLIINEVDYDMVSTDNAEWVELYNAGTVPVNLAGYSIVAVNGANGSIQSTANLSAVTLAVGDYYVVGAASVPNVDQVVTGNDRIQNGGADAVILRDPSSTVVDAISYEGNSIAPYIEGTGLADGDDNSTPNKVIARRPNGADTNNNSADWAVWCATPGVSNDNSADDDLDGVANCLDACPLAMNGTANLNTTTCNCDVGFDPTYTTIGPNQVITACNPSDCDIVLGTPVVVCNSFTPGTSDTYTVSIPYTGVEAGVTVVNNGASGTVGGSDPATVSNGTITISNVSEADGFSITLTAPCGAQSATGSAPVCEPTPDLVINEVDYDQPSTDTQEFIEILNRGATPVDLGGMKVVLWNGTGNIPYATVTLNSFMLAAGDYFVLGTAGGTNVDQAYFTPTLTFQNGPDGVRLTTASNTIIDQMSYGTGILGSTETAPSVTDLSAAGASLSRVPDGTDTNNNSVDFIRACFSPGAANTQTDTDNDGTADCFDVCPGGPEPGTPCDDGFANTVEDVIQGSCSCAGTPVDCEGVPGGAATPGTPCDDMNPGTVNDVYQTDCSCAGEIVDCLGTPGGPNLPGTPCNDFIASTNDETWQADCQCVGTPCSQNVVLELRSDVNSDQIGWEIIYQNDLTVVCSGGTQNIAYPSGITDPIVETCCLPIGCFRLRVYDSGGDGFVSGGYQLRESGINGRRIIDNFGNFSTGSSSALASNLDNGAFCVPMGNDKPIFASCDKLDWVNNQFIVATENAAVTTQYNVTNTTSGYEFWFFDPNGSYSYRRFRNHATSDGFGSGATRACHMKINGWANNVLNPHIPQNALMNVRIRGRVAGSNLAFGPACRFKLDAAVAACPLVKLQDNPLNTADFSCGVSRVFGGGASSANRIVANPPQFQPPPLAGGTSLRYQFRFRIPGEVPAVGSCIVRPPQTSATLHLNWTTGDKLRCNTTYEVDVRVSKDGGATWCVANGQNTCDPAPTPWGKVCSVLITTSTYCPSELDGGASSMSTASEEGTLTLYPNPNRGDRLFVNLTDVALSVNTVSVDLFDMTGKRVFATMIPVQDGFVSTAIPADGLVGGLYLVNINAGNRTYTERLVIQR